jgi:predicted ATPase
MENYKIKNFRVFNGDGAEFQFAPITALTGCNSSGKSSLTKSLMLLQPFFESIQNDIKKGNFNFSVDNLKRYKLNFAKGKHKLGNFEKIINWGSKSKEFVVEYTKKMSYILGESMHVKLVFVAEDENKSQNLKAVLNDIVIECDNKLFFSFDNGFNIGLFKKNLIDAIHTIDLEVLLEQVVNDIELFNMGVVSNPTYYYDDYEYIKQQFGGDEKVLSVLMLTNVRLKNILGGAIEKFLKKFDNENYKRNEKGYLDFTISTDKFDFEYNHVFPLYGLMTEMNEVKKENFCRWCDDKFIANSENEWYNTKVFKKIIKGFVHDFIESSYDKFSDYYGALESQYLARKFKGDFDVFGGHSFMHGTCLEGGPGFMNIFEDDNFEWEDLSDSMKFAKMFEAIQGWGGYSNLELMGGPTVSFPLYNCISEIAELVLMEVLVNTDISKVSFLEIDRANAQRLYSFESQGTSFNKVLDNYYNLEHTIEKYTKISRSKSYIQELEKGIFVNKWLKELTDFDSLDIELAPEGVGYYVYLIKKEVDDVIGRVLISDVGYGLTPLVSMLLYIGILIMNNINSKDDKCVLCIEEPESNLHPKLQSLLVDMLYDATKNYPIKFILETHSEYIIRKMQVLVAKEQYDSKEILDKECPFRVYYLPKGGKPYDLDFRVDGKFTNEFGTGFFDEASNLAFEIF